MHPANLIGPLTEQDSHSLDMRRIVDLVRAQGIPCIVEQTGGGCATIYAGPADERLWADDSEYYPIAAGPGTFYPAPVADDREFTIGLTRENTSDYVTCEGLAEAEIADEIARLYFVCRQSL
jgi:hypothetical protein